jgi:hypothetical protein
MFSVFYDGRDWRVLDEDGQGPCFTTADAAARRGRWLTTRENDRGLDVVLDMYNQEGALCGTWRAERFEPAAVVEALTAEAA